MSNRVVEIRKAKGLNQVEFAKRIGITQASLSYIEIGKSKLTEANIRLICLTFGINEEWLRDGKGEMMNEEALLSEKAKRLLAIFRKLSPKAQDIVIDYLEKVLSDEKALRGAEPAEKGEQSG